MENRFVKIFVDLRGLEEAGGPYHEVKDVDEVEFPWLHSREHAV